MRLLDWLRVKRPRSPAPDGDRSHNLAFVLLSEPELPNPDEIVRCFSAFASPGETLQNEKEETQHEPSRQVLSLRLSTGELCFVALMTIAVPNGEAESGAQFSLSSFRDGWKLPAHKAHLVVTFRAAAGAPSVVSVSRFTSVLAAVMRVSRAVGVYWGNASATHDSEFFISVAEDQGIIPRISLWTGVSIARERDGRLSVLSLGMKQLGLPNLLLVAGPESESTALETMFDFLGYVADRGAPIPEGETVGRTDDERIPVRYVQSPLRSDAKVWRVELV
jgi:hypothetical protein